VALKRPVSHLAGKMLSPEQVEAHGRAPGTSYLLIIKQLADAITYDFLNREDERLMAAVMGLHESLGRYLKKER
jgi:hypothetical protein